MEIAPCTISRVTGPALQATARILDGGTRRKLGVQLVHTTGVWDEALGTYERVVRLRNLADLRRNVRRLRVDDEVRLPGTGATIDAGAFSVRRPAS